jgi:3',5'-cyclic AMP phosphodiesterase CpdA
MVSPRNAKLFALAMQDPILIAQISDLHLMPRGRRCYGIVDTNTLAERAIDAVNRLRTRPAAVIVSGDIIDSAREADYAVAREILGKLEVPFHLVSGNHDNSAGMIRSFAELQAAPSAIEDRVCYGTDIDAIRLVVLDSSIPGVGHGEISPEQLDFLGRELTLSADRPVVISVHHPPIRTGNTAMDGFGLTNSEALAEIVARHANVLAILSGHVHRSILGVLAGAAVAIAPATGHQLELSVDDDVFAFNLEPPGFFLHRWTPDSGMTTQLAMIDRYPGPYDFPWKKADRTTG